MTNIKLIPIIPTKLFGDLPKLMSVLSNGVRDQSAEGVRYMSQYPPEPATSSYRRTGTLRRSWSFGMSSGGGRIEGQINSNSGIAPYNEPVQGLGQVGVFARIGWHNVEELIKKIEQEFPARIQRLIAEVFGTI